MLSEDDTFVMEFTPREMVTLMMALRFGLIAPLRSDESRIEMQAMLSRIERFVESGIGL